MRMAERLGEKSNWALLNHMVNVVIVPIGIWSIFTLISVKESVVELKVVVGEMQKTIAVGVTQPQYSADSKGIERRLDNVERDVKQLRDDMKKDK